MRIATQRDTVDFDDAAANVRLLPFDFHENLHSFLIPRFSQIVGNRLLVIRRLHQFVRPVEFDQFIGHLRTTKLPVESKRRNRQFPRLAAGIHLFAFSKRIHKNLNTLQHRQRCHEFIQTFRTVRRVDGAATDHVRKI